MLAGIIATTLAVRLIFNPYVADYGGTMPILLNWMAYGYGVPALACWQAARWFRDESRAETGGWVEWILQAAALAFATALMSLELWHIASGGGALFAAGQPLPPGRGGRQWMAHARPAPVADRTDAEQPGP